MLDLDRVLNRLLGSPGKGLAAGLAGGLLFTRRGRRLGRKLVKAGGLAAIAWLAWSAWQRRGSAGDAADADADSSNAATAGLPPAADAAGPPDTDFYPTAPAERERRALLCARAMIAAAWADGVLDAAELEAIHARLEDDELSAEDRQLVWKELGQAASIEELAREATTDKLRTEVYVAAVLGLDADTPEEAAWLTQLASALELEDDLVASIHAQTEATA